MVWSANLRRCVFYHELPLIECTVNRSTECSYCEIRNSVSLISRSEDTHSKSDADGEKVEVSRHDVYSFDYYIAEKLETISDDTSTQSIYAHLLVRDPHWSERRKRDAWRDWIGISVFTSKLVEIVTL